MIINSIRIENFRVFDGKDHFIKFNSNKKLPFNVIAGVSGSGKTSIWQAINYCFFGTSVWGEFYQSDPDWVPWSYKASKKLTEKKKEFKISVEIEFSLTEKEQEIYNQLEKKHFRLTRSNQFKKDNDLKIATTNSELLIENKNNNLYEIFKKENDAENFIKDILPVNVKSYFFYDGAKEDITTLSKKKDNIKEAVELLTGLKAAHKVKDLILQWQKTNPLSESNNKDPNNKERDISDAEELLVALEDVLIENEDIVVEKREKIKAANNKAKSLKNEFDKISSEKKIFNELDKLYSDVKDIELEIDNKEKDGIRLIGENASHIIIHNNYLKLFEHIKKEIKDGVWPKGVNELQAEQLLDIFNSNKDRLIPIVSKKIDKPKDLIEEISVKTLEILKEEVKGNKSQGEDVNTLHANIDFRLKQNKDSQDDIKNNMIDINQLNIDLRGAITKIERFKIKHGIEGDRKENDETVIKEYAEALQEAAQEQKLVDSIVLKQKDRRAQIEKQKKAIAKLKESKDKVSIDYKRYELVKSLYDKINKQLKIYTNKNKSAVESELKKIYGAMWVGDQNLSDVFIDDDYAIGLKKNTSDSKISLSKGQAITLSVAFIRALTNVCADVPPPFVIDAPTLNVDGGLGIILLESLSSLDQVFLFVLPEREYIQGSKEAKFIDKHASNIIVLDRDPKTNTTKINRIL